MLMMTPSSLSIMCGMTAPQTRNIPPQVGVHHLVPLVYCGGPYGRVIGDDAGVVYQYVNLAPNTDELLRNAIRIVGLGHVESKGLGHSAAGTYLIDHPRQQAVRHLSLAHEPDQELMEFSGNAPVGFDHVTQLAWIDGQCVDSWP